MDYHVVLSDLCFVLQLLRYLLKSSTIFFSFSTLTTNYSQIVVIVKGAEFIGLSWCTIRFMFRSTFTQIFVKKQELPLPTHHYSLLHDSLFITHHYFTIHYSSLLIIQSFNSFSSMPSCLSLYTNLPITSLFKNKKLPQISSSHSYNVQ